MDTLIQLFNGHSRSIATAASIALIIMISLSAANTVLFVMEHADEDLGPVVQRPQREVSQVSYRVSDLELFGSAVEQEQVEVVDAPETKLNLELQGVFIADNADLSTAIIGERAKAGELYAIGERLPGNATLSAVLVDHVLIKRGTRIEKLMFSDSKFRVVAPSGSSPVAGNLSNSSSNTVSNRRQNLEQIRNRLRNAADAGSQRATNRPPPPGTQDTSRASTLSAYQERLKSDPSGTLEEFGVSPVGSGAEGYRIGAGTPDVVKRAGLRPGDVVLSVNGRPVGVAANDSALIDQVMASSRVRVEVQRGNRRFFMTVPVPK